RSGYSYDMEPGAPDTQLRNGLHAEPPAELNDEVMKNANATDLAATLAPPPASRTSRQRFKVAQSFDSEPVDLEWASAAELRIYDALHSSGIPFVWVKAECRTAIC